LTTGAAALASRVEAGEVAAGEGVLRAHARVGGVVLAIVDLLVVVEGYGGAEEVTARKLWGAVARDLGVDPKVVRNASTRLRKIHRNALDSIFPPDASAQVARDTDALALEVAARGGAGRRAGFEGDRSSASIALARDRRRTRAAILSKTRGAKGLGQRAARCVAEGGVALPDEEEDDLRRGEVRIERRATGLAQRRGGRDLAGLSRLAEERLLYFVDEVGVSRQNAAKVLEACPQIKHLSVRDNLRPTVRFLVKDVGIPADKVRKIIVAFPQLLGLSVEDNLRPTVRFLLDEVGLPRDKLGKTILTRPHLLASCVDNNLRAKLNLLHKHAGIPMDLMPEVIARSPHVLGLSEAHMLEFMAFVVDEVGVERAKLEKMLLYSPQLLGLSVKGNLRPKIRFLIEEVGVAREHIGKVIGTFPNILGYSVEANMRPKLDYLARHVLEVPMVKLGRVLFKCPQLLGYSLEKRIKPRHELLKARGLHLGLSRMLAPTDAAWGQMLEAHEAAAREDTLEHDLAARAIRAYAGPAQQAEWQQTQECWVIADVAPTAPAATPAAPANAPARGAAAAPAAAGAEARPRRGSKPAGEHTRVAERARVTTRARSDRRAGRVALATGGSARAQRSRERAGLLSTPLLEVRLEGPGAEEMGFSGGDERASDFTQSSETDCIVAYYWH